MQALMTLMTEQRMRQVLRRLWQCDQCRVPSALCALPHGIVRLCQGCQSWLCPKHSVACDTCTLPSYCCEECIFWRCSCQRVLCIPCSCLCGSKRRLIN